DLEYGIFGAANPPRFSFAAVVYFRALTLLGLHLPTADRRRIYQLIVGALDAKSTTIEIGSVAVLKIGAVWKDVEEKLRRFGEWKHKLVSDDAILGGEPVFPKSRLA